MNYTSKFNPMLEETQEIQKKTCATIFLLPGIGLKRQELMKRGFISAYIDDELHDVHYERAVYLLYKPQQIEEFQKFLEEEYKRTPLLVEDYDYQGGYVVTVYKFPEEFIKEYDLFLKGKYSKFRKKYVELFPTRVKVYDNSSDTVKEKLSLQYHIFNRTNALRKFWEEKLGYGPHSIGDHQELPEDLEYWSMPNIIKETLNINELWKAEENSTPMQTS